MAFSDYDFKKVFLVLAGLLIFFLAISATITSVYLYNQYQALKKTVPPTQSEVQALVAKIGKLIKLPEGELPTVATITDLSKLDDQPFFAKAKVGDKVLLFTQAKKAILYDPIGNVVVEVGPLILPAGASPTPAFDQDIQGIKTASPTSSLTPTASILKAAVYNGTSVGSTLDNFVSELQINFPNLKIVQKSNAAKRDYAKTLLIDLAGNKKAASVDLAEKIRAEISALPWDEQTPTNADLLIILGQDRLKTE